MQKGWTGFIAGGGRKVAELGDGEARDVSGNRGRGERDVTSSGCWRKGDR